MTMNLTNRPHTIFTQDKAREVAEILNADVDDDFTYKAVDNPNPNGPETAIIQVFDEDNVFIALV